MKKLFAILLLLSSTAFADPSVSLNYGMTKNQSGTTAGTESDQVALRIASDVNTKGTTADLILIQARNQSSNGLTNTYEFGLAQKFAINENVIPYVRIATGAIMPSTRTSMTYIAIEPGVVLRSSSIPVFAKIDYTVGTGLNTSALDATMTRVALGYNITKNTSLVVRQDWVRGDMKQETTWLSLGYRF